MSKERARERRAVGYTLLARECAWCDRTVMVAPSDANPAINAWEYMSGTPLGCCCA